ncbi:KR domain-containing protein [Trichoderma camerunense]
MARAKEERRFSSSSAKVIQSTTMGSGNIFSCPGIFCQSQDYAPLVGFSRTIRTEVLSNSAIYVFAKFPERQGDGVLDSDSEFAVANGPRRADGRNGSRGSASARGGRLASLKWVPREQKHLTSAEIEIKLHAIDLNFKCRLGCPLRAVNNIPCPDEGVGTEYAGMIRRVGPGVRTLRPDDPVMTVKAGIFTVHVIILKKLCVQIPDNISFQYATAMITVFSTVAKSMFNVAYLKKGQASAIQLAKKVRAAMYATVGKGEKAKFLMNGFNIPRSRTCLHHNTSAGDGPDDVYFVRELDSLGCAVYIVMVSVVNTEDVARAIELVTNLKSILQTSMVLCDETFFRIAYEDCNMATFPKVGCIWNLHEAARETSIKPDIFSSMWSTTGLAGQSNYASANTCLVQDAGCVANDEPLLKRRSLANTSGVSEPRNIAPSGKKDGRITAYHNASNESDDGSGASRDFLEILLAKAKTKTSMLKSRDAGGTLLIEIGKRLFMFLLKSEDDTDVSTSLAALGLDSLVVVEMRSWWCRRKRREYTTIYGTEAKKRCTVNVGQYCSNGIMSQRLVPGNTHSILGTR